MFQITKSELEYLRSNFSTANINPKSRSLPHAFTEQGIYMLAIVLKGELAEQQSIFIMRAFREMRHYIKQNQKFEADAAYIDIYQQAIASIYVVDDYVNTKTLQLLSQKKQGVEIILFTENGHGRKGFLTKAVVNDFVNQYPPLRIKSNPACHDRLIVIDYGLPTEQAYHCGASSKDAGKKLCAINKIENTNMIHSVINDLLVCADKII